MKAITYQWIIGILLLILGFTSGFGIGERLFADQVVTNTTNISSISTNIKEIKIKLTSIETDIKSLLSSKK